MSTPVVGITEVDLGAYPGTGDGTYAVVGQSDMPANAVPRAWIHPRLTDDHTVDEHKLEPLLVSCSDVTAGVGFTITVASTMARQYGKWSVAWSWQAVTT